MPRPQLTKKRIAAGVAILTAAVIILTNQPSQTTIYFPIITKPGTASGYAWAWFNHRDKVDENGATWYYRYYPFKQSNNPYPTLEFIPMVKCNNQLHIWKRNYSPDYAGFVLWLNEPIEAGQCPMSPNEAWVFYQAFRELCPHCKIIGPNMSNRTISRNWFELFMFNNPDIYAVGIHNYTFNNIPPDGNSYDSLERQLDFYSQYGRVWVTEWGTDDAGEVAGYLELFDKYNVERSAYFAPFIPAGQWVDGSSLYDEGGELTDVGEAVFTIPEN